MNLSPHFTLEEFSESQTAGRKGIDNDPPSLLFSSLSNTAEGLEQVRTLLGDRPIRISSGYRSPALNKAVGGSASSQHVLGEAVDFTCPAFGTPRQIVSAIVASKIPYDQVIQEFDSWVHISFSTRNRRQALIIDNGGTRPFQ